MPLVLVVMFVKAVFEGVRVSRAKAREMKAETLCARCQYAHVQYAVNAKRAISCAYGGAVRPMKLDVLYCTDYQLRNSPTRTRTIGFVREIVPAE